MVVQLNHTIVSVRDKRESATFLAEILGLAEPTPYGPFLVVQVDNDVSLDFADDHGPVHPQHYAFLVSDSDFDQIFGRIRDRGLPYWADPGRRQPGEIGGDEPVEKGPGLRPGDPQDGAVRQVSERHGQVRRSVGRAVYDRARRPSRAGSQCLGQTEKPPARMRAGRPSAYTAVCSSP